MPAPGVSTPARQPARNKRHRGRLWSSWPASSALVIDIGGAERMVCGWARWPATPRGLRAWRQAAAANATPRPPPAARRCKFGVRVRNNVPIRAVCDRRRLAASSQRRRLAQARVRP